MLLRPHRNGGVDDGPDGESVQPVGRRVQNRPERVWAAGRPERHRVPERHRQLDDGPEPDLLHIRIGVPVHIFNTGNRRGLGSGHHVDDRRGRRQHVGDHRHRHGESAEERAELVHSQPSRGRLLPGHNRHAVLVGQRADGLLDIRRLVVRYTRRPGRAPVHRVHHEPVPDRPRSVLVHHAGRRLPEKTDARPGYRHDWVRVDIQWCHLHTTIARLEGQEGTRTISQMRGEWPFYVKYFL